MLRSILRGPRLFGCALVLLMAIDALGAEDPPAGWSTRYGLRLDPGSVAVQFSVGGAADGPNDVLAAATWSSLPLPGWAVAELPAGARRNAEELPALLAEIAARPGVAFVSPVLRAADGSPVYVTPDVFLAFEPQTAAADEAALARVLAGRPARAAVRHWGGLAGVHKLRVDLPNGLDVLALVDELAAQPGVRYAEPDVIVTGRSGAVAAPDDPFFPDQWGLQNTGQLGGLPGADIKLLDAWEYTQGDLDTLIVVLDTGVQQDHPDLHLVPGHDFTIESTPENPLDGGPQNMCDIHATWVASCATGLADNGIGISGVAPGCRVASARIGISNTPTCNLTWSANISWTADAILWAQAIGARVTNNSNAISVTSALVRDAYDSTRAAGLVHFGSAGNDGDSDVTYPASLAAVLAVGAVDRFGNRAFFSNYGGGVDFMAPGEEIWSTDRTGPDGRTTTDYALVDGTSFASPHAAGIAALVLSLHPDLGAYDVEQVLKRSCTDLGAPGFDSQFSSGLVNARAALDMAACYSSWADLTTNGPTGRTNHAVAYDRARGRLVLFGGLVGAVASRETWEFDGSAWMLRSTTGPTARYGHAMAYDAARGRVILHGGFAGAAASGETWAWDGANWSLASSTGPAARFLHAMVYDAADEQIVLFGGRVGSTANDETWTWNGTTWTQATSPGPAPRTYHALAYDASRDAVVLFGGTAGGDETWEWTEGAWALVSTNGPAGRERAALVYSEALGETFLFGGLVGTTDSRETWSWDGTRWRLWSVGGPAARQRHAAAYRPEDESIIMFGGLTGTTRFSDTWKWNVPAPLFLESPSDQVGLPGSAATFRVGAAGESPLAYRWLRDGVPLDDDGRISGANTATLRIEPVMSADAGSYVVRVADVCAESSSLPAALAIFGDGDADGDVDVDDSALFAACLNGPGAAASPTCLAVFDVQQDGDVDLRDFAGIQSAY